MRIVFAGTPQVAVPALAALATSAHEVAAVITRPDAAQGRSRKLMPSPVAAWAVANGIELLRPSKPGDQQFLDRLAEIAPDCCPVVAYGALVPTAALTIPRLGWVNLHFSVLPAYRGAAPVQRAIMNGETETGVSVFQLVQALDAGPVFNTCKTQIAETTTSGELLDELADTGAQLLVATLDQLEVGTATATEQSELGVRLAPKLTVAEAEIDWTAPAAQLQRLIHGCNPAPGAWTRLSGQRFKVLRVAQNPARLLPGQVAVTNRQVLVGTGDNTLELVEVQPGGKKAMSGTAWGRGAGAKVTGFDNV